MYHVCGYISVCFSHVSLPVSYESYWQGCSLPGSPLLQPIDSFCISKVALLGPRTVTVLSSDLTAVLKDPLLCCCIWKNWLSSLTGCEVIPHFPGLWGYTTEIRCSSDAVLRSSKIGYCLFEELMVWYLFKGVRFSHLNNSFLFANP